MKFLTLFKKELRELVTIQSILGIAVAMLIFLVLGNVMSDATKKMASQMGSVVVVDNDNSEQSKAAIDLLKKGGYEVTELKGTDQVALSEEAKSKYDHASLLMFGEGFGKGIESGKTQELTVVTKLTSFSIFSNADSSATAAAQLIKESLSSSLVASATNGGNAEFYKEPVKTTEITVANGKTAALSAAMIGQLGMQQTMFIPLIIFILITFASQLNASAIANEKNDKTLETLLSTPVSRLSVLAAKMCASGVLSLLMAVVYMFGFSSYMGSMMGSSNGDAAASTAASIGTAMRSLGLELSVSHYLLLGVELFLTMMIVLAVSLILGALAKDLKSAQSLMMPLMFIAMIPYFVTMFMDVSSLPTAAQVLLYLIPFTHTFTAAGNMLFGDNTLLFIIGIIYQAVVLAGAMALAVRIFSTDKIFTTTIDFSRRSSRKKKISE